MDKVPSSVFLTTAYRILGKDVKRSFRESQVVSRKSSQVQATVIL
jgi:hypothetical protein